MVFRHLSSSVTSISLAEEALPQRKKMSDKAGLSAKKSLQKKSQCNTVSSFGIFEARVGRPPRDTKQSNFTGKRPKLGDGDLIAMCPQSLRTGGGDHKGKLSLQGCFPIHLKAHL